MPSTRGITLRIRRPQQDDDQDLPSGSSLTSLETAKLDQDDSVPTQNSDHEADVTMGDLETQDTDGKANDTPRAIASRTRRIRLAKTKSQDIPVEQQPSVRDNSSTRKSARQTSTLLSKQETLQDELPPSDQDKDAAADDSNHVDNDPNQEEVGSKVEDDQQDATSQPPAVAEEDAENEEDDEEHEQQQQETDLNGSPTLVRIGTRGRGRGRTSGRARGRGRGGRGRGRGRTTTTMSGDERASDNEDPNQEKDETGEKPDADGDEDSANEDQGTAVDAEGHTTITIKNQVYRVEGDEVILPSDVDGDKKIDEKGRLLDGRQYKAYNFTSNLRPDAEKVYMLSIDAARAAGYRDSLYFFRKNPQIIKIILYQGEKDKLIEDGRLSGQLKSRNVTMIAARNVFKIHGARFVSGGRAVIDDYYEAAARASGAKEGKTVGGMSNEDQERKREVDRDRDRSRRRPDAFTYTTIDAQGDPVVTVFGDSGQSPWARAGNWASRKQMLQRAEITEENWVLEMAKSVRGMNAELAETRRDRLVAFRRFDTGIDVDCTIPNDHQEERDEQVVDGEADPADDEYAYLDLPPWEKEKLGESSDTISEAGKKRKAAEALRQEAKRRQGPPIGLYEPNTHLPHFSTLTQPSWAVIEKAAPRPLYVNDPSRQVGDVRPVLGGDRMGSGGWGIASFCTEMIPPARPVPFRKIPAGVNISSDDNEAV